MRNDLNLRILSPANIAFTGVIDSVHVPAALGELEIFLNHAPMVSSLLPGVITVHHTSGSHDKYFVNGGYVEIHNNEISLIVDDIMDISDVNKEFYQKQIEILSKKLQNNRLNDAEYDKVTHSIALYKQYSTV
jgi:F-type H+-transporting ATPase subunit epsilon